MILTEQRTPRPMRRRASLRRVALTLVVLLSGCGGVDEPAASEAVVAVQYAAPEDVIRAFELAAPHAEAWSDLCYPESELQRELMRLGALARPAGAVTLRTRDGTRAVAAYTDAQGRSHDLHLVEAGDRWWISGFTFEYDDDVMEFHRRQGSEAIVVEHDFESGLPADIQQLLPGGDDDSRPGQYRLTSSDAAPHRGARSGCLRYHGAKSATSDNTFGPCGGRISAIEHRRKRMRLTGFLRTDRADLGAGFWMRVDGADGVLAIDNMMTRPVRGTTGWAEHSVVLDVAPSARWIYYGVLLRGGGAVWFDDVVLEEVADSVGTTG